MDRVSATSADQGRSAKIVRRDQAGNWSLTARALNAVGWSYVAGIAFLLSQVGYTALTARLVSPSAFGAYALALTIVQLASLIGTTGLADSVMRVHELTDRGARTALTLAIASGLLFSVVLIALSPLIERWFRTPALAQALRLLSLQPPMLAAAGVSYGLLRRAQRYKAASLIQLTASLVGFAVGAVATASGLSAVGLSLGQVTNGAAAMVMGLYWARISLRPTCDRALAREFSTFSVQVAGQNLGHYGIGYLPLWSVARLAGGAATGLFSRGYQVVALPSDQFASGLMRAAYPLYREVGADKDRTRRALTDALVLTSCACAIVFGAFAAVVQPATLLLLGIRWTAAAAVTPVLCAFAAANLLYSVLASACEAMRWMRMIWVTQLVFVAVMTVSLFIAAGRLEATAEAMVVASLASHIFMLTWVWARGSLYALDVLKAYSIHIVLGVVIALVPTLVSRWAVGNQPIPELCVRAAVLGGIGFWIWIIRRWIPGLRLGLIRWSATRSAHVPRHRGPVGSGYGWRRRK